MMELSCANSYQLLVGIYFCEKKSFIKDVQLVSKLASKKFLINTFSITVILDIFAEVIIQCEEWKCQNRVLFKFTFIVRFQNLTIKIIRILLKIIRKSLEIYWWYWASSPAYTYSLKVKDMNNRLMRWLSYACVQS